MPSADDFPGKTPTNFRAWTLQDIRREIAAEIDRTVSPYGYDANYAYIELRDHWQNGDTWVGPDGGSLAVRRAILDAVQRQFTPVDLIAEALDTFADALLQREPGIAFVALEPAEPETSTADAQQKEADAMYADVSKWWDGKRLWEHARHAAKRSRWAMRGALRLWISPAALELSNTEIATPSQESTTVLPTELSFADALGVINVNAPLPDACFTFMDLNTQTPVAVFLTTDDEGEPVAEMWFTEVGSTNDKGERNAADATVYTVLRIVGDSDAPKDQPQEYRLETGGRLPIHEMPGSLLITDAVRRQQARANFFETLLLRIGETAGFPERYTTNAKPQGIWLQTKPTNGPALDEHTDGEVTWYLHPSPRTLGASITTDLRGLESEKDDQGRTTIATPGVIFKEPTDPQGAINSSIHARRTFLQSCHQGHMAMESRADSSGVAYEQARASFESDLNNSSGPLTALIASTIEYAIALAEQMAGGITPAGVASAKPGTRFLDRYRCVVTLHPSAGPITAAMRTSVGAEVEAGRLSKAAGMAQNGVEDVSGELEAIATSPEGRAALTQAQGTAVQAWTLAGLDILSAVRIVVGGEDPMLVAKSAGTGDLTQPVVP